MGVQFGGAVVLLMVALLGSAAGKLSEDDLKTLKVLQASLAKVKDWDTFTADTKFEQSKTYIRDFLLPVKNVIEEDNTVVFQKSKEGDYKSYTNIKRDDIFQVSILGYESTLAWQYEWVRMENETFWLKIDKVPPTSQVAQQYHELVGQWVEGDEGLRAGYDNRFTDHIEADLDSAEFLKEENVASIKAVQGADVDGRAVSCFVVEPMTKRTTKVADEEFIQKLAETEHLEFIDARAKQRFPNRQSDKRLMAETNGSEKPVNLSVSKSYGVCISKDGKKDLLELAKSQHIGPVSVRAGSHILLNLVIKEISTRTYSGFNEPVKFPKYESEKADAPPTQHRYTGAFA
ncbi:hypothetical protein BSKO_09270 [Bryopsis sp. KO-2023]|nr:hypothetical protein BSKO_09270 [Bryopsis sp. KO-2023]